MHLSEKGTDGEREATLSSSSIKNWPLLLLFLTTNSYQVPVTKVQLFFMKNKTYFSKGNLFYVLPCTRYMPFQNKVK